MKTISFFSPKGGCGKTTLSILFAAYVSYYLLKRVLVIDLEAMTFPIERFRQDDLEEYSRQGSPLQNYCIRNGILDSHKLFDIKTNGMEINTYTAQDVLAIAKWVQSAQKSGQYDLIIIDCPAGFSRLTPFSCLVQNELIDRVFIPMSTDIQERRKACSLGKRLQELGVRTQLLWYRINPRLVSQPQKLDLAQAEMVRLYGLYFCKTRVPAFNKASEGSDVKCFVRNTICWPERYVRMFCPAIEDLFLEIADGLGLHRSGV